MWNSRSNLSVLLALWLFGCVNVTNTPGQQVLADAEIGEDTASAVDGEVALDVLAIDTIDAVNPVDSVDLAEATDSPDAGEQADEFDMLAATDAQTDGGVPDAEAQDTATPPDGSDSVVLPCLPADCDDQDACTNDVCEPTTGKCGHLSIAGCITQLIPCTNDAGAGLAVSCPGKAVCDPDSNACVDCTADSDCDAGSYCNKKQCVASKVCLSSTDCKSTNQICDKEIGACVDCLTELDCGDAEVCAQHQCVAAAPCQSDKDCAGVCDLGLGYCVGCLADADCGASQHCAPWGQCRDKVCTTAACGLSKSTAQDLYVYFSCNSGGSGYEVEAVCDEFDAVCGQSACDSTSGCFAGAKTNGASCSDGNGCTEADFCDKGICEAGPVKSCSDGDACNSGKICVGSGTCVAGPSSLQCDDKDKCTVDSCNKGLCVHTPAEGSGPCDDTEVCTTDSCSGNTCVYSPIEQTQTCDDGNPCTVGDLCASGNCNGSNPDCDDGKQCTADSCDTTTGCKHVALSACAETSCYPACSSDMFCDTSTTPLVCKEPLCAFPTTFGPTIQKVSMYKLLPTTEGCDLDGDNKPNNVMGKIYSLYKEVNTLLAEQVADGSLVLLFESKDWMTDGTGFELNLLRGDVDPSNAGCDLVSGTANCKYTIQLSSYDMSVPTQICPALAAVANATVANGVLAANGSDDSFMLAVPVTGLLLNMKVRNLQISANVSDSAAWKSSVSGKICGVVTKTDVEAAILVLPDEILDQIGGKQQALTLFNSLLAPDIDLDNDGKKDAVSVGLGFETVPGQITGLSPTK